MTDEERERTAATYERMHRALDDRFERREEYERYAAERRQRELNEPPATPLPAPPVHPTQRPRQRPEGRDWAAEQRWIEGIVAGLIKARDNVVFEAVGQALAEMARREETTHWRPAIDALRAELEKAIAECRREYLDNLTKIFGVCDRMEKSAAELSAKADELQELPSERARRRRLPH